jgi:hypothetical protein
MPSILYLLLLLLLLLPRRWNTMLVQINILENGEIDFLHSGVTDCAGWVIACSGGEGEAVRDSIKEINNILRAYTCTLRGDRLGVADRLRRSDEDFVYYLSRFKRTRIYLSPLACRTWLIAVLATSSALESFD